MALAQQHIAAVLAEVAASGLPATMAAIQSAYIAARVASAQTELAGAISLTVSDWDAVNEFLAAGVASPAVYPILAAIQAKIAAEDATGLDVLLFALYAATKAHLGG